MSRPSNASIMKYQKKAYDRLYITIPKGRADDIASYAQNNGNSTNGLINKLLRQELNMTTEEWKKRKDA